MTINKWRAAAGTAVLAAIIAVGASALTWPTVTGALRAHGTALAAAAPTRESLLAEGAKLDRALQLIERRRRAVIEASAKIAVFGPAVRRLVSTVGPFEENLHQRRVDNLVLLAQLRRDGGAPVSPQLGERRQVLQLDFAGFGGAEGP